jgi:hypothetical protein
MFGWSRSFSYFQRDSCNDQSVTATSKSAAAVAVLAPVGKSFGLGFEVRVVIIVQVPAITPIATQVRFCSYLQYSFRDTH